MSAVKAAALAAIHGQNPIAVVRSSTSFKPTVAIPPRDASQGFSGGAPKTPKTPADEGIEFFESVRHGQDEPIQVYELRLEADGGPSKEKEYIRLPPANRPYVLRVSLDAGVPAAKNGVFKTNFPLEGGTFERTRFVERKLPTDFSSPIQINLPISHAGAFVYRLEYDGEHEGERVKGRDGYFNIDPILRMRRRTPILSPETFKPVSSSHQTVVANSEISVPLDGIAMLTVMGKWLGDLNDWKPYLEEASARGYNMLHFTPLQQRGESGSPFSIADQLSYDAVLFGKTWTGSKEEGVRKVQEILRLAKEEHGLLSLTDVVLNHTANNSPWLPEHPEAGYSPKNTPHLAPAEELDRAILDFSVNIGSTGLPKTVTSSADIDVLVKALDEKINALQLWQYYVFDVSREKSDVLSALAKNAPTWDGPSIVGKTVAKIADVLRDTGKINYSRKLEGRFALRSDPSLAARVVRAAFAGKDVSHDTNALSEAWGRIVDVLNVNLYKEWEEDAKAALDQIKSRLKYIRLDEGGPKWGEITKDRPLVELYFTRLEAKGFDTSELAVANNGWIWAADPLNNFALPPSKAYLRREVIVWGDCVKLRYGDDPESNPWLWEHMTKYVTTLAETFDGFRLDNCHSTPLNVGVTLLDSARAVKPDLYVCAELFTGSQEMDLHFVSRLGINSLIREALNGWDPKELSRLLYSYGLNKPLGSMDAVCLTSPEELPPPTGKGPSHASLVTSLFGSVPHALMYDVTHDNPAPAEKRSAEDALANAALTAFSYCATGSTKGVDELYPKLLDLVNENRRYAVGGTGNGISEIRRIINHLHVEMVLKGYSEGHVHQENDYIILHRVQPSTQEGFILIAHTAFSKDKRGRGDIDPITLRKTKARFVIGAALEITSYDPISNAKELVGLPSNLVKLVTVTPEDGSDSEGAYQKIIVPEKFPPGSIMIFRTQLQDIDPGLEKFCGSGADDAFQELGFVELNVLLHRAEGEERDATNGTIGAYDIGGLGKLVYCGLEGWMHPLRHVMRHNDLGHPLCNNLRDGVWALEYIHSRLQQQSSVLPKLTKAAEWFDARFSKVKMIVPPFLRPKFFAIIISEAYKAARRAVVEQCSEFISTGHSFTQDLALCSVQMYGLVKSASLDPSKPVPSLAAGLPHFTAGWARTWGRDVFISLRGLFLTTGNFQAAKAHILCFASTLKHGLIPNLLDSTRTPRYNSRDSPWWMLQNIQDYVLMAPDGLALLSESIKRRFPRDDTWVPWDDPRAYSYSSTIAEIIQEILQRHAEGIHFREDNAGPNLDMQMSDQGFNIDIEVDWKSGLILGGNAFNCGTWMDKMGESQRAGTKGKPGTPRDGAPVEITGLLKSTLRWLDQLSSKGKFPFRGVHVEVNGSQRLITYKEWNSLIQASFEQLYYVPEDPSEVPQYHINPALISRRGIYKDVFGSGSGREWSDYQLRCNFPIAMVVAPELFDPEHARGALKIADEVLRAPLGMRTLDPKDSQYRPYYDNSNDSDDAAVAKGLNYHNGPEWGWPLGYFLRAYLYFDRKADSGQKDVNDTLHRLHRMLLPAARHIKQDPWAGIPELTNLDGQYCSDSCNTQAWSASTLLDFLHDVNRL